MRNTLTVTFSWDLRVVHCKKRFVKFTTSLVTWVALISRMCVGNFYCSASLKINEVVYLPDDMPELPRHSWGISRIQCGHTESWWAKLANHKILCHLHCYSIPILLHSIHETTICLVRPEWWVISTDLAAHWCNYFLVHNLHTYRNKISFC